MASYITHGVLSGIAAERIRNSRLRSMTITDSIMATKMVAESHNIQQISIAPLLAAAIDRIHNEQSVSSLFD